MSVQGEIIRITEAKTDIASAINEQGYTQVDEDASISTYADAIRANTNTIWEYLNSFSESDPIFQASPANAITTSHVETLNDLEAGYITTENSVFTIVDSQDHIITQFDGNGIETTKVVAHDKIQFGTSDEGLNITKNSNPGLEIHGGSILNIGSTDGIHLNSDILNVAGQELYFEARLIESNSSINFDSNEDNGITFITGATIKETDHKLKITASESAQMTADQEITFSASDVIIDTQTVHVDSDLVSLKNSQVETDTGKISLVDRNDNIVTILDNSGISTTQLSADTIKISGGTDDFVLLAGGGVKQIDDLATKSYVSVAIAEAELSGGDVDLSGYATKDDLNTLAKKSDLNGYLPLSGGILKGDLTIQRGESALSLSNCELYFNNGGIDCSDPTAVSFHGHGSFLDFFDGGNSSWSSDITSIYSSELTIGGQSGSEANIYLGREQNNSIYTYNHDTELHMWSSECIRLQADGDGIYLNAPSVGFGEIMGVSQGQVTLYNDTRLDFTGESGNTTMGPTEDGFIISNDGELKLTGDSIVVNAADSIYFSTSSDTTFNSKVYVTDDVHAQAFYETSDARKKDIKSDLSLDKCYDLIDKCQTVIYSLKDQTKEQVGMIAQEIEEFFPEVVATDEEGFKSLAYDRLVVICFKVLKDVIKRLEVLETHSTLSNNH